MLPFRGVLRLLEGLYGFGVAYRNRCYDRQGAHTTLPVPVISVGNITVGGTGKTPLVLDIVKRLQRMGFSPAVVSRGYKASGAEPNDEERLLLRNVPDVPCVADADRVAAAEAAHRRFGADVIVLDDGFQHRRLERTLDVVVIDATCPFGYEHLLPRGLLREPVQALKRADVIVITRCDQVARNQLAEIEFRLGKFGQAATILQCTHRATGVQRLDGTPANVSLSGKRVAVFAAIGQPRAFATTVRSLGAEVVAQRWWPDHHHYRRRDIDSLLKAGRLPPHELLLTTEKDATKLVRLAGLEHAGILVLQVAIDFVGNGGTILQMLLRNRLGQARAQHDESVPTDRPGSDQDL